MSLNTLAFATKFADQLDKMITQKAVTGFMADNVLRAKFVGAKTVILPDIDFVGLADYDRDSGFAKGAMSVNHTSYQLNKDRARTLQIDREDMDETGIANLAGKIMSEYVRTKVIPEVDAYTLSKLAGMAATADEATGKTNNTIVLNTAEVYAQFNELANGIYAKTGYDSELVAFVNPTVYAALMNSAEIQRMIVVSDFEQGEINLKVKKLNDVVIIPVAADRMKTEYTFGGAVKDKEGNVIVPETNEGGFNPTDEAKDIGMLVLPKKAAHLVKKSEKIRVFEPDTNQSADAYKFDYRIYYDVFVKKSELNHIAAAIEA